MASRQELAKRYASLSTRGASPLNKPLDYSVRSRAQEITPITPADQGTFAGNIARSVGGFVGGTAKSIGSYAVNATQDIIGTVGQLPVNVRDYVQFNERLDYANNNLERVQGLQDQLHERFRNGQIDADTYAESLQSLANSLDEVNGDFLDAIVHDMPPEERAVRTAEGLINAVLIGRGLGPTSATSRLFAGVTVGQAPAKLVQHFATSKVGSKLAYNNLIERNIAYATKRQLQKAGGETLGQFVARESRDIAFAFYVKRPLVYEWNIGDGIEAYKEAINGQYGTSLTRVAWMGSQMLKGGPLGAAVHVFGRVGKNLRTLTYGKNSFIDEISRNIGPDDDPNKIFRYLNDLKLNKPEEFAEAERVFKMLQEVNLRVANNDGKLAAELVLEHYLQNAQKLDELTPERILSDMRKWADADQFLSTLRESGVFEKLKIPPEQYNQFVVVRWDSPTKKALADRILEAKTEDKEAIMGIINELAHRPGVGWGNNEILYRRIEKIVEEAKDAEEIAKRIRKITTASVNVDGLPKNVHDRFNELGFTIARPQGGRRTPRVDPAQTRKLATGAVDDIDQSLSDSFELAATPLKSLEGVGKVLQRMGISPVSANQITQRQLIEQVSLELSDPAIVRKIAASADNPEAVGRRVLATLRDYMERKKPAAAGNFIVGGSARRSAVQDLRQLWLSEITEALDIDKATARKVRTAIIDAHNNIPLEIRGLGDRAVDKLYKFNPAYPVYSRIQSALRYTYNPFFRVQEIVETKTLSKVKAGNLVWQADGVTREAMDNAAQKLTDYGIFTGTVPGEAAEDVLLGKLSANLTQSQRRDMAGLALTMAKARGVSLDRLLADNYQDVEDALRIIVQYPREGVLASSLARTINLAAFPTRYNAKVTAIAVRELSKAPPVIQYATIKSLLSLKDWLQSEEGIVWRSENAEAIGVFGWLTPVGSVTSTIDLLTGDKESPAEFGLLGGLPFGLITQVLDSQGIIELNRPYVDPKTGDVVPEYIPETLRARAATAATGILSTMFTYPGRVIGLPGKNKALRDAVRIFIENNGSDFDKNINTDELTESQRRFIEVLKGDLSDEAIDSLFNASADGMFDWYTLPPLDVPVVGANQGIRGRLTPPEDTGPTPRRSRGRRTATPLDNSVTIVE